MRRGRPPKATLRDGDANDGGVKEQDAITYAGEKRRGRPPKRTTLHNYAGRKRRRGVEEQDTRAYAGEKRRGRPPKTTLRDGDASEGGVEEQEVRACVKEDPREYSDNCYECLGGGKLLMCDGRGCMRSCHVKCAGLSATPAKRATWYCHLCWSVNSHSCRSDRHAVNQSAPTELVRANVFGKRSSHDDSYHYF